MHKQKKTWKQNTSERKDEKKKKQEQERMFHQELLYMVPKMVGCITSPLLIAPCYLSSTQWHSYCKRK